MLAVEEEETQADRQWPSENRGIRICCRLWRKSKQEEVAMSDTGQTAKQDVDMGFVLFLFWLRPQKLQMRQ